MRGRELSEHCATAKELTQKEADGLDAEVSNQVARNEQTWSAVAAALFGDSNPGERLKSVVGELPLDGEEAFFVEVAINSFPQDLQADALQLFARMPGLRPGNFPTFFYKDGEGELQHLWNNKRSSENIGHIYIGFQGDYTDDAAKQAEAVAIIEKRIHAAQNNPELLGALHAWEFEQIYLCDGYETPCPAAKKSEFRASVLEKSYGFSPEALCANPETLIDDFLKTQSARQMQAIPVGLNFIMDSSYTDEIRLKFTGKQLDIEVIKDIAGTDEVEDRVINGSKWYIITVPEDEKKAFTEKLFGVLGAKDSVAFEPLLSEETQLASSLTVPKNLPNGQNTGRS